MIFSIFFVCDDCNAKKGGECNLIIPFKHDQNRVLSYYYQHAWKDFIII